MWGTCGSWRDIGGVCLGKSQKAGMSARRLRIVFMGTPDFAVPSLRLLCASSHSVVGVVTAPDKARGRGRSLKPSPVKCCALSQGLSLWQPQRLRDPEFQQALRTLKPDLQVVVAFRMLPASVWDLPPMGSINLHASLLPKYRGAAPIHWAIMNGEKETGLTTFFIQHAIDTGRILRQQVVGIGADDTMGSLHDKLKEQGGQLLLQTVDDLAAGRDESRPQAVADDFPKAPKVSKDLGFIDWMAPPDKIVRWVRGLTPVPGAFCRHRDKQYRLHQVVVGTEHHKTPLPAGMWYSDRQHYLHIGCGAQGYVEVKCLQKEGGRPVGVRDFLRGIPRLVPRIHLLAALDENRVIGRREVLPWHLPDDLKRFRQRTTGQVVLMGRKTYESLPEHYKPLPARINIVLTRRKDLTTRGCWQARSLDEASKIAQHYFCQDLFVIGGQETYTLALQQGGEQVAYLHLTRVETATQGGDAFFPSVQAEDWICEREERHEADERHAHPFSFCSYRRKGDERPSKAIPSPSDVGSRCH